jgi:hypothetical protein
MHGVTTLHLGALHPIEQVLTLALAFGPLVVLAFVVWWRRREDDATVEAREPER